MLSEKSLITPAEKERLEAIRKALKDGTNPYEDTHKGIKALTLGDATEVLPPPSLTKRELRKRSRKSLKTFKRRKDKFQSLLPTRIKTLEPLDNDTTPDTLKCMACHKELSITTSIRGRMITHGHVLPHEESYTYLTREGVPFQVIKDDPRYIPHIQTGRVCQGCKGVLTEILEDPFDRRNEVWDEASGITSGLKGHPSLGRKTG